MTYRDDREAMQSRIAELESELSAANDTILRLRGEVAGEIPADDVDRFTGIPRFLHLKRDLPFEVSDEAFVAIADMLRARIPGGSVSQVGNTLTHSKGSYELRLSRGGGRTSVELKGDYRSTRLQLALGTPGLALIGAVLSAGAAAAISRGHPAFIAIGLVLGAIAGFALLRTTLQRGMAKDRQLLRGAFESVVELATAHSRAPSRMRIDATEEERDALAEEEAAAAEATERERERAQHQG